MYVDIRNFTLLLARIVVCSLAWLVIWAKDKRGGTWHYWVTMGCVALYMIIESIM